MKQQKQQRFRLDMRKFPTVLEDSAQSAVIPRDAGTFSILEMVWKKETAARVLWAGLITAWIGDRQRAQGHSSPDVSCLSRLLQVYSWLPATSAQQEGQNLLGDLTLGDPCSLASLVLPGAAALLCFWVRADPRVPQGLSHAVSFGVLCVVHSLYTVGAPCWLCRCVYSRDGEDSCGAGLCLRINRPGFEPHNCHLLQAAPTFPHLVLLHPAPV